MILCNNPGCSAHKKGTDQLSSAYLDFAGRWYCNKCGSSLLPNEKTKFVVTTENNACFVRSERLYKEGWLLKNDLFGYKPEEAKAEALDLCRNSMSSGNPYATVSLADYYEQGTVDEDLSASKRWNNALNCNAAVAFNEGYFTVKDEGAPAYNMDARAAEALRFEASVNIIRLISNCPIDMSPGTKSSYIERAQEKCAAALDSGAVDSNSPIYSEYTALVHMLKKAKKQDNPYESLQSLTKIVESMTGKRRPPLFHVAHMTRADLEKIGEEKVRIGRKNLTLQDFCRSSQIKLFISKIEPSGNDFDQFKAYSTVDVALSDTVNEGTSFYVLVYNQRKPQGLKQEIVDKLWKKLLDDYQMEIRTLISMHIVNDYVFGYDDIKLLPSKRNVKSILDDLKTRIREYFDIQE